MNWIPDCSWKISFGKNRKLFSVSINVFETLNISHRLDLDSQSEAIITASTAAIFSTETPRTKGCIFLCPRDCSCDRRSYRWRRSQHSGSTGSSGNSDTAVRTRQHRRDSSGSRQTSPTADRAWASGLPHFRSTSRQEDPTTATSTHQIPSDDRTAESIVVASAFPCLDDWSVVVIVVIVSCHRGREFDAVIVVVLGGITTVWILYTATAARRVVVVSRRIFGFKLFLNATTFNSPCHFDELIIPFECELIGVSFSSLNRSSLCVLYRYVSALLKHFQNRLQHCVFIAYRDNFSLSISDVSVRVT